MKFRIILYCWLGGLGMSIVALSISCFSPGGRDPSPGICGRHVALKRCEKKTDPSQVAVSFVDSSTANPKLVQVINNLQERLYAERRENRRLKSA